MSAVVLRGDARALPLPDESVDLIVTSPPYFGQRDYRDGGTSMAGQIGSEETPREYIAALLECTAEWARVLKPSGSIFVNLGDKYSQRTQTRRSSHQPGIFPGKFTEFAETWAQRAAKGATRMPHRNVISADGGYVAEKSLMGLPSRYAIACMDDLGLILRRDIIWAKMSALPESVTDRCATRHEYLFHLTKQPRYYSAVDEIREPHKMRPQRRPNGHRPRPRLGELPAQTYSTSQRDEMGVDGHPLGALPSSVWQIAGQPLSLPAWLGVEHYAAFPCELPRRCILGWSPPGICVACGEGRRPVVDKQVEFASGSGRSGRTPRGKYEGTVQATSGTYDIRMGPVTRTTITGYACACPEPTAPTRPSLILDPFAGTGTTLLVADVLGRNAAGFDLSADYCRASRWRISDPGERARAMQVPKPPPVPDGQGSLFDASEAS